MPSPGSVFVHPDDVSAVFPVTIRGSDWNYNSDGDTPYAWRVTMRTQRVQVRAHVDPALVAHYYDVTPQSSAQLRRPAAIAAGIERLRQRGHSEPAALPDEDLIGKGWR